MFTKPQLDRLVGMQKTTPDQAAGSPSLDGLGGDPEPFGQGGGVAYRFAGRLHRGRTGSAEIVDEVDQIADQLLARQFAVGRTPLVLVAGDVKTHQLVGEGSGRIQHRLDQMLRPV